MADACVLKVLQAAQAERDAVCLDRSGDCGAAIVQYEASLQAFAEALDLAQTLHSEDVPALTQHRRELQERSDYLRGLGPGTAPAVPVEQHVRQVQLRMRATMTNGEAAAAPPSQGMAAQFSTQVAAAAVGAVGGAITLGLMGAPVTGALAGAAGMGYAASRQDGLGGTARGVGQAAVSAASRAREADQRYGISGAAAAGAQQVSAKAQATGAAVGELASRGREARGASAPDGYRFGDLTRGLVAEGKEARGAGTGDGYKFGDFSRGVTAKLTGRLQSGRGPTATGAPAPSCEAQPAPGEGAAPVG